MQVVLSLRLDWHYHLAYVFKEVPSLLQIAIATLNQTEALPNKVTLITLILRVQLFEDAIDLVLAVFDLSIFH